MMAAKPLTDLRGVLRTDEPMRRHTTWRVGGPADRFYEPADLADLCAFLAQLPEGEPLLWVGLGSNLLVRDGGIRGTVVCANPGLGNIEALEGHRLRAEAGVPSPKLARHAARLGWVGLEFLAGIPGTIGGALAMNAGAFGGETWPRVESVETVDRRGVHRRRAPEDYAVGYRSVRGPEGEWFVAATFRLESGDAAAAQARIREWLDRRGRTQPTKLPSCGSVFRNPPGDAAGRLIEAAGLKGFSIGGAEVSQLHANFIINRGGATAADIEAVMTEVHAAVRRVHGVDLRSEVRIVGESPGGKA